MFSLDLPQYVLLSLFIQVKMGLFSRIRDVLNLDYREQGEEHAGHGKGGKTGHSAQRVLDAAEHLS